MPIEDQQNPDKTYNKLTVKELSEKTQFNWLTEIFEPALKMMGLPDTMNNSVTIRISDINYVVKATELLKRTAPRTVANASGNYQRCLFRKSELNQ